jgi:hypothetical protein
MQCLSDCVQPHELFGRCDFVCQVWLCLCGQGRRECGFLNISTFFFKKTKKTVNMFSWSVVVCLLIVKFIFISPFKFTFLSLLLHFHPFTILQISRAPIFGNIARTIGCIFVGETRTTSQLQQHIMDRYPAKAAPNPAQFPNIEATERNILVFPEATTTNGSSILAFRSGVFAAKVPVHLVAIKYPHKFFNLSWETIPLPT